MIHASKCSLPPLAVLAAALLTSPALPAQDLQGKELVESLRAGGYVLVMRTPYAGQTIPQEGVAGSERDGPGTPLDGLDAEGVREAREVGEAIRGLEIPIADIHTSSEAHAVETAQELQLGDYETVSELETAGEAEEFWLRDIVGRGPVEGNALVITHEANIGRAFPAAVRPRAETGEVLIFDPASSEEDDPDPALVARLKVGDWEALQEEAKS